MMGLSPDGLINVRYTPTLAPNFIVAPPNHSKAKVCGPSARPSRIGLSRVPHAIRPILHFIQSTFQSGQMRQQHTLRPVRAPRVRSTPLRLDPSLSNYPSHLNVPNRIPTPHTYTQQMLPQEPDMRASGAAQARRPQAAPGPAARTRRWRQGGKGGGARAGGRPALGGAGAVADGPGR